MLTLKEGRGGEREKRNLETENKFLSKNGGGVDLLDVTGDRGRFEKIPAADRANFKRREGPKNRKTNFFGSP